MTVVDPKLGSRGWCLLLCARDQVTINHCDRGRKPQVVAELQTERLKYVMPIVVIIGAIILASLIIMARPEASKQAGTPIRPLIDIVEVSRQTVSIPVAAQGNVRPRTQTQLIADVAGRVTWLADDFRAGGYFKKDDEMARIDDRNYIAAVKRAKAAVAGAKSTLASEQGRADVALKEWKQRGKNVKRSEAATELYLRKPQLNEAKARLESAEADLLQAEADLEHTVVRAPYSAMVGEKNIDVGQSLSPGAMIGGVFAVDKAEVKVPLPERQLQFVSMPNAFSGKGEQASDSFPKVILSGTGSLGSHQWEGRLVRTEGVLDEKTRAMTAVIEVEDPYGLLGNEKHQQQPLRIGAYVAARIAGKPITGLMELSQAAINPGNKVWLVNEQGRLEQRTVDILMRTPDKAYISDGLQDNDRVSVTSLSSFTTGAEVRIASINGKPPEAQLQLRTPVTADQEQQQGQEQANNNAVTTDNE